jgi:superfamily II DNA or RNA helicase
MILKPRPYQVEANEAVKHAWKGGLLRPAVVLPTGAGKTVTFAHLINDLNESAVILVHRDELADQAADKLLSIAPDMDVGIVKAARNDVGSRVKICSIQTLYRPERMQQLLDAGPIGLVVYDEAQHAPAPANRSVLEQLGVYETTKCVGFTATMSRSDDVGLGDVWEEVVFERDVLWGIANGFLVDVRAESVMINGLNLAEVARSRGDYQDGQLGDALIRSGAGSIIARSYKEKAGSRQGIVFCPTVACAYEFARSFNEHGISAAVVVGETPKEDRQRIYQEYRERRWIVLVSVMALTEGFDMPQAEVCVPRPTENSGLFQQCVGRVLRPFPGKDEALVLDVFGTAGHMTLRGLVDLSPTVTTLNPQESLREAYEREQSEEKNLEADVLTGKTTSKIVNLFQSSSNVWLQTPGGRWFIPTREGYVFLWPFENKFKVGVTGSQYQMKGGRYLQENPMSLELAMAWGEQLATEMDETVSQKDRSWRKKKAQKPQRDLADRLGVVYSEGVRKGDLSDRISLHFATQIFD